MASADERQCRGERNSTVPHLCFTDRGAAGGERGLPHRDGEHGGGGKNNPLGTEILVLQVVFPTSQFSPGFLAVIPVDLSLVTGQQLVQSPRRSVSARDYIKRSNAKFGTGGG